MTDPTDEYESTLTEPEGELFRAYRRDHLEYGGRDEDVIPEFSELLAQVKVAAHVCGNCCGIDPSTCLTDPDRNAARLSVDQATVLREAADAVADSTRREGLGWEGARDLLRRMADEETSR